jgi:hypothetical protein
MRTRNRSFLSMSLVPALLVVSVIAVLGAPEEKAKAAQPMRWSDPATWPNGKVPVAGERLKAAVQEKTSDIAPSWRSPFLFRLTPNLV